MYAIQSNGKFWSKGISHPVFVQGKLETRDGVFVSIPPKNIPLFATERKAREQIRVMLISMRTKDYEEKKPTVTKIEA